MKFYPTIAVDFDGTLQDEYYPNIGNPNLDLIHWLLAQQSQGAKIILWTCREGKELVQAIRFCDGYGLVFDAINSNPPEIKFYSRKVCAHLYIDDNCTNTADLMDMIKYSCDEKNAEITSKS